MNLTELHPIGKPLSAVNLFKGDTGTVTALQLDKEGMLKEHVTKTPALLLCISGQVIYEDETGQKIKLESGDYVAITPMVKHWLLANAKSQLVLMK